MLAAPFVLVLGFATFSPASAVDNFLGAGVSFPLIKWTGAEALDIFQHNHTIWRACIENEVEESLLMEKEDEMRGCLVQLRRKDTRAHSEAKNLRDQCGQLQSFLKCMETGAEDYVKMCELKDDVKEFLEDSLENNKVMMSTICEDDESVLYEYLEGDGRECAKNMSQELAECVTKNARDDMKYDEEGCRHARNFVRCADFMISKCSTEKAEIVSNVMDLGLMATHCKDFDPRLASSTVLSSLLMLTSGLVAALFAWRF